MNRPQNLIRFPEKICVVTAPASPSPAHGDEGRTHGITGKRIIPLVCSGGPARLGGGAMRIEAEIASQGRCWVNKRPNDDQGESIACITCEIVVEILMDKLGWQAKN